MTSAPLTVDCDLLGDRAGRLPELQRRQAVAVHGDVDVGRIGVERLADDPADLAVRIDARARERRVGADDEVAGHLAPGELELVARGPHVGARADDGVGLRRRIVGGRARDRRLADVAALLEVPERLPRRRRARTLTRSRPPNREASPTPSSRATPSFP